MKKTRKKREERKVPLTLKLMSFETLQGMEESMEGYYGETMLIGVPGGLLSIAFDRKKKLTVMELLYPEEAISEAIADGRRLIRDTDRQHRQREKNPFHPDNLVHLQDCNPDER
jgi:hypothetical protein